MIKSKSTTRPKFKRKVRVTDRDIGAMQTLSSFGLLRESTLHQLCFATLTHQRHVQGRLKRLVDQKYIGRRLLPVVRADGEYTDFTHQSRREPVYFLEKDGATLIGQDYDSKRKQPKLHSLFHSLDIADIRACLELSLKKTKGIKLASWWNENDKDEDGDPIIQDYVTLQNPKTGEQKERAFRPDACFVLEDEKTGKQELFFLEVDEGTESGKRRWKDKVFAYRAYWEQGFQERYAGQFQGEGFRLLTVNRSETGKEQAKRKHNLVQITHKAGGRKMFWFATFDQVMPEGKVTGDYILKSPVWKRVDWRLQERELALKDHLF